MSGYKQASYLHILHSAQDFRLYVLCTSVHPLRAYIFKDGLVRFGTEKYDQGDLSNLCSHLTNTSINKRASNYSAVKEGIGSGCKWTLTQLQEHMASVEGLQHAWGKLWIRMCNVCVLTLLLLVHSVPQNSQACFELFGFDVMVDEQLKPWIIEVNASPALGLEEPADETVKNQVVADTIKILNLSAEDRQSWLNAEEAKKEKPRGEAARQIGKARGLPGMTRRVGNRTVVDAAQAPKATKAKPNLGARSSSHIRDAKAQKERHVIDPALREGKDIGGFELLFPLSEASANAAWTMCHDAAMMKQVVDEVRSRELSLQGGTKVNFRAHHTRSGVACAGLGRSMGHTVPCNPEVVPDVPDAATPAPSGHAKKNMATTKRPHHYWEV